MYILGVDSRIPFTRKICDFQPSIGSELQFFPRGVRGRGRSDSVCCNSTSRLRTYGEVDSKTSSEYNVDFGDSRRGRFYTKDVPRSIWKNPEGKGRVLNKMGKKPSKVYRIHFSGICHISEKCHTYMRGPYGI